MKIVIANFKSNKNRTEYEHWLDEFQKQAKTLSRGNLVILAPAIPDLFLFANRLLDRKTFAHAALGVQDLSSFPPGAYTGAVSTRNLEGFNVTYAIVGHSERRRYFHENETDVALKVEEALAASITPIVCVTRATVQSQANALTEQDRSKVIVAFEPIDHIGTGIADSIEDILAIRKLVKEVFGEIKFIYGGSVDPHTDLEILQNPNIDGFLVGTATLDPKTFVTTLQLIH